MTGILGVNKTAGVTSFKEVSAVRRLFSEKKCGHTGTLDPQATGVLPVALGGATRFIELLPDHTKQYRARFRTGFVSDTLDCWGDMRRISEKETAIDDILPLLDGFRGRIKQLPPMFSALKKDGVRLYELARRGETVERSERECEIFLIECAPAQNGEFELFVKCSAGTYIRTLIDDIGSALGTGAVMTALERVGACGIDIADCVTVNTLFEEQQAGYDISKHLIAVDELLTDYPAVEVTAAQGTRFRNGGDLMRSRLKNGLSSGLYRIYSEGSFIGIGELTEESESLTVKRVFSER